VSVANFSVYWLRCCDQGDEACFPVSDRKALLCPEGTPHFSDLLFDHLERMGALNNGGKHMGKKGCIAES